MQIHLMIYNNTEVLIFPVVLFERCVCIFLRLATIQNTALSNLHYRIVIVLERTSCFSILARMLPYVFNAVCFYDTPDFNLYRCTQ